MNNITPPQNCETCGSPMNHIPAGVSKTKLNKWGQPAKYDEFWGCSQKCGFIWRMPKGAKKDNGSPIMYDEMVAGFKGINERLDKLIEYIVKNLPEKNA